MYCRNRYYSLSCEGVSPKMLARRDQRWQRGPARRSPTAGCSPTGRCRRFYIMIANTLALITSDLEAAAAILGTGRLVTCLHVF